MNICLKIRGSNSTRLVEESSSAWKPLNINKVCVALSTRCYSLPLDGDVHCLMYLQRVYSCLLLLIHTGADFLLIHINT